MLNCYGDLLIRREYMYYSLLGSFAEFMQDEWLGLVASIFVLISFIMSNQIKIRIINMVGCVAWVIYGFLRPSYSSAIMNGAVFIVHIIYLTKYFLNKRKEKNAEAENSDKTDTKENEISSKENDECDN